MNGMIFAAGLGTRLAPLTASMPNRPLLEWAIEHFVADGVNNIVVNVHHKADQVEEFLYKNQGRWHADIAISDERAEKDKSFNISVCNCLFLVAKFLKFAEHLNNFIVVKVIPELF